MSQEGQYSPPPSSVKFPQVLVAACALLGVFLIFTGQIVNVYARAADVVQISFLIMYVGGMFLSGALIAGGIANKNLDKFVRLGMLLAAGLIIASMSGSTFR